MDSLALTSAQTIAVKAAIKDRLEAKRIEHRKLTNQDRPVAANFVDEEIEALEHAFNIFDLCVGFGATGMTITCNRED